MQNFLNTVRFVRANDEATAQAPVATVEAPATVPASTPAVASKPAKAPKAAKPTTAKKPASDNGKAAAKRVATKTATGPAKPTQAERERQQAEANDARRLARDVAARAVAEFYSGASKPFKAAADRFADINTNNGKTATARQAGLALALITYGAGNMRSDGTFTRGAFTVPAKLINPNAKPGETIRAQPESGCLGNMLGRAADYVSGPKTGREQSAAVYRLRPAVVLAEIEAAFGQKTAKAAATMLAGFDKRHAA